MAHFIINGREYRTPEKFTLGETAALQEITGVNAGDIEQESGGNVLLTIGLMTLAVKRAEPNMSYQQARMFVEALDADAFDYVDDVPAADVEGVVADPPSTLGEPGIPS